MTRNESALATERIRPLFIRMVIPAVAAQLVTLVYHIVDRIYIGHIPGLGGAALTGVGVCMPIMITVSAFAQLIAAGGAPRVSALMGMRRTEDAERTLGVCCFWLLAIGAALTALGLPLARSLLLRFGASETTLPYALGYLRIYLCGTVFALLSTGLAALITAQGFTGVSLLVVAAGTVLNLALDPVFIFAFGMGVEGAALATVLSQAVSTLCALIFLCGPRPALRLRARCFRPAPRIVLPCMALGLSPFFMTLTECFVTIAFNRSLLRYGGDTAVGAMTVFSAVLQIAVLPMQGFSQGAQPITSYNYGAGNISRVTGNIRLLIAASLLWAGALWLCIMLFPRAVTGIFTSEPALIDFSVRHIRIYFGVLVIMGLQFACQNTFVALGNAKTSIFLAVVRKVILLIPLIYLLPAVLPDKTAAVFLAEPISDTLAVCTTLCLFLRSWRRDLRGGRAAPGKPEK